MGLQNLRSSRVPIGIQTLLLLGIVFKAGIVKILVDIQHKAKRNMALQLRHDLCF